MRKIDRLIKKAKSYITSKISSLLCDNDDGFLTCLGVDLEKYAVTMPDNTVMYDCMKVLCDCAQEDWKEHEDVEETVENKCTSQIKAESFPEEVKEHMKMQEKKKKTKTKDLFGWG